MFVTMFVHLIPTFFLESFVLLEATVSVVNEAITISDCKTETKILIEFFEVFRNNLLILTFNEHNLPIRFIKPRIYLNSWIRLKHFFYLM